MVGKESLFKVNHWARSKRPRGVLRRANRILDEARKFKRELGPDDWFQYAHWHRDWRGIGNLSIKIRLLTLKAHLTVFEALAKSAAGMGQPFQLFISMVHDDAGQDAVYLHTPNPHSEFPADFSDASWGVPALESLLNQMLPGYQFLACRQESNYVAYALNVGLPLFPTSQDA